MQVAICEKMCNDTLHREGWMMQNLEVVCHEGDGPVLFDMDGTLFGGDLVFPVARFRVAASGAGGSQWFRYRIS